MEETQNAIMPSVRCVGTSDSRRACRMTKTEDGRIRGGGAVPRYECLVTVSRCMDTYYLHNKNNLGSRRMLGWLIPNNKNGFFISIAFLILIFLNNNI